MHLVNTFTPYIYSINPEPTSQLTFNIADEENWCGPKTILLHSPLTGKPMHALRNLHTENQTFLCRTCTLGFSLAFIHNAHKVTIPRHNLDRLKSWSIEQTACLISEFPNPHKNGTEMHHLRYNLWRNASSSSSLVRSTIMQPKCHSKCPIRSLKEHVKSRSCHSCEKTMPLETRRLSQTS